MNTGETAKGGSGHPLRGVMRAIDNRETAPKCLLGEGDQTIHLVLFVSALGELVKSSCRLAKDQLRLEQP